MRTVDPATLEPDQLAFCIETNGAINARRFIDFLQCFGAIDAPNLPIDGMDIVELSSGSFFGRLRIRWDEDRFQEDRLAELEKEFIRLRGKMERSDDRVFETARRGVVAAEIAAAAAQRSAAISLRAYRETVKGRHIQYYFAALATTTLMLTVWEKMDSPDPNPCAEAASAIMDLDGAPRIHLWTQIEQICVHRQTVGHDRREAARRPDRPEEDRINPSSNLIIHDTPPITDEEHARWAHYQQGEKEGLFDRDYIDYLERSLREKQKSESDILRARGIGYWVQYEMMGTLVDRDGTDFFLPDGARAEDALLVVLPERLNISAGERFLAIGEAFINSDRNTLVLRIATHPDDIVD